MIKSIEDEAWGELCGQLAQRADALDAQCLGASTPQEMNWPAAQLQLCIAQGVLHWHVPERWGGMNWSETDLVRGYQRLSAACLATTFLMTQPIGALKRILNSEHEALQARLVPKILAGEWFCSVGVAHLTTSRRHMARPMLLAQETSEGFVLEGVIPWVSGGTHAQGIVIGATLPDERQILAVLPTDLPGVDIAAPARMVGLGATHTGAVTCHEVLLAREWLLAGPVANVMTSRGRESTGGLQTSALALGHAQGSIRFLQAEAARRPELGNAAASLELELQAAERDLLQMAAGNPVTSLDDLRSRANSLALRSAQAALTGAKGSGYLVGHPAGRWCREALFFLVWSCTQNVQSAALCELANLES